MYLFDKEMKIAQKNCKKFKFYNVEDKDMLVAIIAWIKGYNGKVYQCNGSKMYYDIGKDNELYVVKEFELREQNNESKHNYLTIKATPFGCEIKNEKFEESSIKDLKKKQLTNLWRMVMKSRFGQAYEKALDEYLTANTKEEISQL